MQKLLPVKKQILVIILIRSYLSQIARKSIKCTPGELSGLRRLIFWFFCYYSVIRFFAPLDLLMLMTRFDFLLPQSAVLLLHVSSNQRSVFHSPLFSVLSNLLLCFLICYFVFPISRYAFWFVILLTGKSFAIDWTTRLD